ncbi:hypothetical protein [Streptosporangium sp. NPDC051022]|uniref:hypothetical protein n=1 Tax=Streptosporangium sp. NPDC051022 TaxID=3155752 RepID=UPI0034372041
MNEIVDRLRDAATAVGKTVEEVPPFRPEARRAGGRRTRRSWAVPLVAAATVTGVVAGAGAVIQAGRGDGSAGPVAGAGPEFFAVGDGGEVVFRRSDTGERTGRFALPVPASDVGGSPAPSASDVGGSPASGTGGKAARSVGGRFALVDAARDAFYTAIAFNSCETRFFRVKLGRTGKVTGADALHIAVPEGTEPTSLAVSADGSKLAYSLAPCGGEMEAPGRLRLTDPAADRSRLGVTDLATGRSRVFTSRQAGQVLNVSITADGRSVAFQRLTARTGERLLHPRTSLTAGPVSTRDCTATPTPTITVSPPPAGRERGSSGGGPGWQTRMIFDVNTGTVLAVDPDPKAPVMTFEMGFDDPEVWVLDPEVVGGGLDTARRLRLRPSPDAPEGVHGIRISADGRSFTAALGRIAGRAEDGRMRLVPCPAEIATFDFGSGGQTGVLYRDGLGGLRLVDADGSGGHLLVQRGQEFGAVDAGRYRGLLEVREPYLTYIGW